MRTSPTNRTARGFTLVEIAVVLFIVAVLVAMAAAITRGVTAAQKRSLTATRIAGVDAALLQFVAQQKRLPCPANGTLALSAPTAGEEVCPAASQANGVVPWKTLGLTEVEATDGWDRRLTYRVDPNLALASGMDMSWCDPAGTEAGATPRPCNTACVSTSLGSCTPPTAFLLNKGLRVQNTAATVLMNPGVTTPHTGAAYVVISHGESGGGGYMAVGGTLAASATTDGDEEKKNYANLAYPAGTTYFVDDTPMDTGGATHFDDIVSRPSVMAVITKAGLGPRAH